MATLKSPYDGGVIDVPDELADRYTAAGWLDGSEKPKVSRRSRGEGKEEP